MGAEENLFEGRPIRRTPTRAEVERAWIVRQAELDDEAGIETDSLLYSREFRVWYKNEILTAAEQREAEPLISTVEALDALSPGTVVIDDAGNGVVFQRENGPGHWMGTADVGYTTSRLGIKLPALLIFEPRSE